MPQFLGGKTVEVPVKSASSSKINWVQIIGLVCMGLSWVGIDVPEDVRAAIATGIGAITMIITWVLRTYFTNTVLKSSL